MNDEEIKKALECCAKGVYAEVCDKCPFRDDGIIVNLNCLNLEKYALNLINRQQAEIERLKYLLKYEEAKYDGCAKQFYKAGVKEFADKYTEMIIDEYHLCTALQIDNIKRVKEKALAEMVGGEDA